MKIPWPPPFLSGLEFGRLAAELRENLTGTLLQKVQQGEKDRFAFTFRGQGRSPCLVVSAWSEFPAVFIGSRSVLSVPGEPPALCRLLRKDLVGRRVADIIRVEGDRILALRFEGGEEERSLVIEILGRFVDLVLLTPSGRIRGCLRADKKRGTAPGGIYHAPRGAGNAPPDPAQTESPWECARALWEQVSKTSRSDEEAVEEWCRMICGPAGLSRLAASEWLCRAGERGMDFETSWRGLVDETKSGHRVCLYRGSDGEPLLVSGVRFHHLDTDAEEQQFPSLLSALSAMYERVLPRADFLVEKKHIEGDIRRRMKRIRRDAEAARRDLEESRRENDYRVAAETILAHLPRLRRGMSRTTLPSVHSREAAEIEVSLDPALTPQENAEHFFRKASKARRRSKGASRRISELEAEQSRLEEALSRVLEAPDVETLGNLTEELRLSPRQPGDSKRAGAAKRDPVLRLARVYRCSGDTICWVAKGALAADEILRRHARGNDTWLHIRDAPGAHVFLKGKKGSGNPPDEAILDAAHLAAHFSKLRGESVIPVHVTQIKHLRKVKGSSPGKVVVAKGRTVQLRVDPERLQALLKGRRPGS